MKRKTLHTFTLICSILTLLFTSSNAYAQSSLPNPPKRTEASPTSPQDIEEGEGLLANWEVQVTFPNNELHAIWKGYIATYRGNEILSILDTREIDITDDCTTNGRLQIHGQVARFKNTDITCELPDYRTILERLFVQYTSSFKEVSLNTEKKKAPIYKGSYTLTPSQIRELCECRFSGTPWAAAQTNVISSGIHPLISVMGDTPNTRNTAIVDFQIDIDGTGQTVHSRFDFIKWPGNGLSSPMALNTQNVFSTVQPNFIKLWSGYEPNHYLTANALLGSPDLFEGTSFANDVQNIHSDQFVAWAENTPMITETVKYDPSAWEASTMKTLVIGHKPGTSNYLYGSIKEIRFDPGCRGFGG